MPYPPLSNAGQKLLRALGSRQGRRKSDHFLAEGVRCAAEALARRPDWVEWVLLSESFGNAELLEAVARCGRPVYVAPDKAFAEWALTESPQGILLVLRRPDSALRAPTDPFVLVLDRVGDPGNVGTILRTAWAVGLSEVVVTGGGADAFAPKCVRAGMGAQFAVSVRHAPDLAAARAFYHQHGYERCWLTTPHGGVGCFDDAWDLRRGLLVLGNEAAGVDLDGSVAMVGDAPDVDAASEARAALEAGSGDTLRPAEQVCIPMPGSAESLNVAQAGTILLFDAVRRGLLGPGR